MLTVRLRSLKRQPKAGGGDGAPAVPVTKSATATRMQAFRDRLKLPDAQLYDAYKKEDAARKRFSR